MWLVTSLVFAIGTSAPGARAQDLRPTSAPPVKQTPAEAANYLAYTSPDTALVWLTELATQAGPVMRVDPFLAQPGGVTGPPVVIPKVSLGVGLTSGIERDGDRVRVLVIGSQHGDERTGYEVALRLARDLAIGELRPLLEELDVTIVPVMNPVGMRAGTRFNGSGFDPNRDHVSLAAPVNRSLWELHAAIEPHVVLDLHDMGPSPYEAQVGLPTHPNVDPKLVELARYRLLPWVVRSLATANVRFHEYVAENPDPASRTGNEDPAEIFFSYAPFTANNARNAFSLSGSLALLLETASSHEIDDLSQRADRLYLTTESFLEVIAGMSEQVLSSTWQTPTGDTAVGSLLALQAENVADPNHPSLRWLRWTDRGSAVPYTVDAWRPVVEVQASLPVPSAWLIPAGEAELVAHLLRHGIRVERLLEPVRLPLRGYNTRDSLESVTERTLPAGSWLVRSDQVRQRLLFTLIEPGSADGWFRSPLLEPGSTETAAEDTGREFPLYRFDGPVPSLPLVAASPDDLVDPYAVGGR